VVVGEVPAGLQIAADSVTGVPELDCLVDTKPGR